MANTAKTTVPAAVVADAKRTVTALTDGRKLTPLDMLKLGHTRRTLAQAGR